MRNGIGSIETRVIASYSLETYILFATSFEHSSLVNENVFEQSFAMTLKNYFLRIYFMFKIKSVSLFQVGEMEKLASQRISKKVSNF